MKHNKLSVLVFLTIFLLIFKDIVIVLSKINDLPNVFNELFIRWSICLRHVYLSYKWHCSDYSKILKLKFYFYDLID